MKNPLKRAYNRLKDGAIICNKNWYVDWFSKLSFFTHSRFISIWKKIRIRKRCFEFETFLQLALPRNASILSITTRTRRFKTRLEFFTWLSFFRKRFPVRAERTQFDLEASLLFPTDKRDADNTRVWINIYRYVSSAICVAVSCVGW